MYDSHHHANGRSSEQLAAPEKPPRRSLFHISPAQNDLKRYKVDVNVFREAQRNFRPLKEAYRQATSLRT